MAHDISTFNIKKFGVHDGPGIRTTVFLKGCPLNCQWCANPESANPFPELFFYKSKCIGCQKCFAICVNNAIYFEEGELRHIREKCTNCGECVSACIANARKIIGQHLKPDEVFEVIMQDKAFYEQSGGGVTFSGGEPFLYPDYISQVAEKCKQEEIGVAVETCGAFDIREIEKIIEVVDLVLFDIKIIDEEKHLKYCGNSNKDILSNFSKLIELVPVKARVPIIPSINDSERDIELLCDFFIQHKEKLKEIHILPYHNLGISKYDSLDRTYLLNHITPPTQKHMENIKSIIEKCGFRVKIGG